MGVSGLLPKSLLVGFIWRCSAPGGIKRQWLDWGTLSLRFLQALMPLSYPG